MFWLALIFAALFMWLAFELYRQAQESEYGIAAARAQTRKSHEFLKAQMPRGCVNVRKTVPVDYSQGIPNDYDWDEEMEKTQAFPESSESGTHRKVRGG